MKHRIVISSDPDRKRAHVLLDNLDLSAPWELRLFPYRRNRSQEQNNLMWEWLRVIGDDIGMTREELHAQYKERFAVPILCRDDPGYADMVSAVKKVRAQGDDDTADSLKRQILRLTSTADFNVRQMSEYMNSIEQEAKSLGIRLPQPEPIPNETQ